MTLTVVDSVEEAVELFNTQSPKLVASLIDEDPAAQTSFYETIDAPFRRQWVHPLGGRPVRLEPSRIGALQLGGRPTVRQGWRAVG